MAYLKTHMDLLTKDLLPNNVEKLKVVGSHSKESESDPEEEENYLNN